MSKYKNLPSEWQLEDNVQVVFPGNGKLWGRVVKVAFAEHGEPLYDVEVPFDHHDYDCEPAPGAPMLKGAFRIHGLRQWFLSHTQEDWDKMQQSSSLLPIFEQICRPLIP